MPVVNSDAFAHVIDMEQPLIVRIIEHTPPAEEMSSKGVNGSRNKQQTSLSNTSAQELPQEHSFKTAPIQVGMDWIIFNLSQHHRHNDISYSQYQRWFNATNIVRT